MPDLSVALKRWKDASGLKQVQKGFCFDKEHDQLFALGWPHMRLLTDEPVDSYKIGMARLKETDFRLDITMPRELAAGLLRAWAVGEIFITTPGARQFRDQVESALWNSNPLTREEVSSLLQTRMTELSPMWTNSRVCESMVLLAEALTETEWVAEAIVDTLEGLDSSELWAPVSTRALIAYQLGYLLLRLPKATAEAFRVRLRFLLEGPWGLGGDRTVAANSSYLQAIAVVLGGASAAETHTDHDLKWYTHVTDSPKTLKMRARINRGFTMPDARLLFLGGADLLDTRFGKWWGNLSAVDQSWFVSQVSPIKAPEVVKLMARLAAEAPSVVKQARYWCAAHRDYAEPILKDLADKSATGAREMLERLE